ncbi:hypothetical protein V6N13_043998 [Hibiscus sabdariffa]|uniref:Uncharacterized protein n=1 Tax=Hibiscus sabdariffa TaxID=183260 RepID=A0ABR2RGW1_9ROSI
MANLRCSCLFFLVIILVLSHETVLIEGRSLEVKKNVSVWGGRAAAGPGKNNNGNVAIPGPLHHLFRSLEGYPDDFRPTTPGHSPGAGH